MSFGKLFVKPVLGETTLDCKLHRLLFLWSIFSYQSI